MSSVHITPEYVLEYINKNNATVCKLLETVELLKDRVNALETNKLILMERNEHITFRLSSAEQRLTDLNNTMMNHFAYKQPILSSIEKSQQPQQQQPQQPQQPQQLQQLQQLQQPMSLLQQSALQSPLSTPLQKSQFTFGDGSSDVSLSQSKPFTFTPKP